MAPDITIFGSKSDKNRGSAWLFSTRKRSKKDFSTGSLGAGLDLYAIRGHRYSDKTIRWSQLGRAIWMSAEDNKAVLRRVIKELINEKNLAVVEELFSEEYVTHPSLPGRIPGPETARRNFSNMHATFPDIQATLESIVAEDEWVAIRATMSGTHEETGKRATWPIAVFARFAEGKVAEDWLVADTGQIEAQLGSLSE